LAAGLRQDVDEMGANIEEAELEYGEKPDRPGANDQYVGFNPVAH
jgi:hypothetical protein